jgi:hypothetical protein
MNYEKLKEKTEKETIPTQAGLIIPFRLHGAAVF